MAVFKRREINKGNEQSLEREISDGRDDNESSGSRSRSKFGLKKSKLKDDKDIETTEDRKGSKYLPEHIYIGYRPSNEIKKKELIEYIRGKANEKVSPIENAFYHIEKFGEGYFWEIHDGGSGHSILPYLKDKLDDEDSFSFLLNNDIFAIKKLYQGDSYTFNLIKTKADNLPKQRDKAKKPVQSKKMQVFVRNGFGFFIFSLLLFMFSSIVFGSSFYVRDNRQYDATLQDLYSSTVTLPISKYSEIAGYMKNENNGIYVKTVKFNNKTKKYDIEASPTPGYNSFKNDVLTSMGKDITSEVPPEVNTTKSKKDILNKAGK